ncbi:MAG: alpha-E domain-containing protein [Myxococcales bacterium]|nr:alpha-E domain-containing protein [Myxococcales bacterium]
MMLSRVADSMFWMSRYVERAENIARFVEVNLQLSLDLGDAMREQWGPLVAVTGDEALFQERYGEPQRESVMRFLTFDKSYPNSILACVAQARENARIVREKISTSMWEELNKFHLMLQDQAARPNWETSPHDLYAQIRRASQLFVGVTDGTMSHDEGWHFARLGRLIERADKTTRILDVRYFLLLPLVTDVGTPLDIVQWSALLRSASALDMYRARHGRLSPTRVAEFLLLDHVFPRAVLFCVDEAERSLRAITGAPPGRFTNRAEKRLGRLRSELDYTSIEDIFDEGLHEFIDRVQVRLNEVGTAIDEVLLDPSTQAPPFSHSQVQA